jgi:hypothetical protein
VDIAGVDIDPEQAVVLCIPHRRFAEQRVGAGDRLDFAVSRRKSRSRGPGDL